MIMYRFCKVNVAPFLSYWVKEAFPAFDFCPAHLFTSLSCVNWWCRGLPWDRRIEDCRILLGHFTVRVMSLGCLWNTDLWVMKLGDSYCLLYNFIVISKTECLKKMPKSSTTSSHGTHISHWGLLELMIRKQTSSTLPFYHLTLLYTHNACGLRR